MAHIKKNDIRSIEEAKKSVEEALKLVYSKNRLDGPSKFQEDLQGHLEDAKAKLGNLKFRI